MERQAYAPRTRVDELIEQRRRELANRIPTILVPKSCTFTGGQEDSDRLVSLGLPVYVEAIQVQIRAPAKTVQPSLDPATWPDTDWDTQDRGGTVYVRLIQPVTWVDAPTDPSRAMHQRVEVAVPTYQHDLVWFRIQSWSDEIDPFKPCFLDYRLVWPTASQELPQTVHIDATVFFAVHGRRPK